MRIGLFFHGRAMAQNTAHAAKAAIFLRQPTDWMAPDVRSVARGIRNGRDLSGKFQNYITADDLLRPLQRGNQSTEFGHDSPPVVPFSPMAPSGTLRMRMGGDGARLKGFRYARTGFRRGRGGVAARISAYPNILDVEFGMGRILRIRCLCSCSIPTARALRPVRTIWPRISYRSMVEDLDAPSFSVGSFNSKRKFLRLGVVWRYGFRFPPHWVRTGRRRRG